MCRLRGVGYVVLEVVIAPPLRAVSEHSDDGQGSGALSHSRSSASRRSTHSSPVIA